MKLTKKIFAGFASAAIAASMMAAIPADAVRDGYTEIEPTAENVKLIGRTAYQNDALLIPWSAGGVEFTVEGSDSVRFHLKKGQQTRLAVLVNDKLAVKGYTSTKAKAPVVDVPLEEGVNKVKLIKLSESANSVLQLDSIEVQEGATVAPTPAKDLSIEFIGDSITCGYGVDGSSSESFNVKNENAAKTYAYIMADYLDADYSFVSVSGTGVKSGYTSGDEPNENLLAPNYYDNLCFTWEWIDGANPGEQAWDFSNYQPNLIIVNLGTNDSSWTKGDSDKIMDFQRAYDKFLRHIREKNPNAEILCVLGMMGQDLCDAEDEVVNVVSSSLPDEHIHFLELPVQNTEEDGVAVDWHPSETTHRNIGGMLAEIVANEVGITEPDALEEGIYFSTKDDDVEFVDAEDEPVESESESESESEVTSESEAESTADESADESTAEDTSSKADSSSKAAASTADKTASASTTTNPGTGAMVALSGLALAGAVTVISKRKR